MRIALHEPDIAGNVGTIIRLATCLGVPLDLIEPMGFAWGDRALARAGMDYAVTADVVRHGDWDSFRSATPGRIVLATTAGAVPLPRVAFDRDDILLFGSESSGAPPHVHAAADIRVRIPLKPGFRSLNVAVSVGIILAESLRQTDSWPS